MSKTSFLRGLEIVNMVKSFNILQYTRNSDIFRNFFLTLNSSHSSCNTKYLQLSCKVFKRKEKSLNLEKIYQNVWIPGRIFFVFLSLPCNKKRPRNQWFWHQRVKCDIPLNSQLSWLLYFPNICFQQVTNIAPEVQIQNIRLRGLTIPDRENQGMGNELMMKISLDVMHIIYHA